MSHALEKLQHELAAAQRARAEAEARWARNDAEHQKASAKEFEETYKKIEQAHQEWESALDVVEDPIFMHDKDFRILRCNRAYQRCAGIPFKQIIGQPYHDVFPKIHAPLPSCLRAIKNAKEAEEEVAVGDLIYRSRSCSVNDVHGAYLYSVHTLEDITESRQANQALRESERRLRVVMESVQTGIVIIDPDVHKIVDVNAAAASMIGAQKEEIVGSGCHRFICPAEVGKCPITDLHQSVDHSERVLLTATGVRRPVIKSVTTVLLDGKVHLLESFIDITERKQAEESLHRSEEKYRSLVHNIPDVVWTTDQGGKTTFIGDNIDEVYGYTPEEIYADPDLWFGNIHPDDAGRVSKAFSELFAANRQYGIEYRIQRKDGGWIWIYDPSVVTYEKGGTFYADGVFTEITERKKAETELLRLNRVLKTLSECNRTLLRASDETELMRNMCQMITASGEYSLAWIGMVRQDGNKSIEPVTIAGDGKGYVEALNLTWDDRPNGHGPTGTAVRTGMTQVVQDIKNDPRFELWREAAAKNGYASSIALPLKENGSAFGSLNIYAAEVSAFGDHEVALLEEVADDIAFGIVNLRTGVERDQAVKGRQHYIERLRISLEEALQAIANTVEMRDPYTAGHQRRVAHLATAIARELGLPEEQVHGIHLAGIVHDLGKIHVPAEILSKPGRLDEIEFSFIKTHAQVGYEILKEIQFPWPIAQAVLQHHERLDGSGYPQELKGDAIILEARILAVADVVEAMSSHRPYRPGLGLEVALAEISSKRGIQFDPQVVDACLSLFHEQHYSFNE